MNAPRFGARLTKQRRPQSEQSQARDPRRGRGVLLLAGAVVVVGVILARRERRRRSTIDRLGRMRSALARIQQHPENVAAPPPTLFQKTARAVVASVAAVLARRLAEQLIGQVPRATPARLHRSI